MLLDPEGPQNFGNINEGAEMIPLVEPAELEPILAGPARESKQRGSRPTTSGPSATPPTRSRPPRVIVRHGWSSSPRTTTVSSVDSWVPTLPSRSSASSARAFSSSTNCACLPPRRVVAVRAPGRAPPSPLRVTGETLAAIERERWLANSFHLCIPVPRACPLADSRCSISAGTGRAVRRGVAPRTSPRSGARGRCGSFSAIRPPRASGHPRMTAAGWANYGS